MSSLYLHVKIIDPSANGDYAPAAQRRAADIQLEMESASVEELLSQGCGFVSDVEHVPDAYLNYETWRTEAITEKQAEDHAFAVKEWEKRHL